MINEGHYSPGERLVEAELTEKLKTGRPALRTAFRHLVAAGLVILVPNRGATVRRFSTKDVWDIEQIRELIEPFAAYEAAKRSRQADKRARLLEAAKIWARQSTVADLDTFIRENKRFHQLLIELTGNKELEKLMDRLNLPLFAEQFRMIPYEGRVATANTYTSIIKAIMRGDAVEARRLMKKQRRFGQAFRRNYLSGSDV